MPGNSAGNANSTTMMRFSVDVVTTTTAPILPRLIREELGRRELPIIAKITIGSPATYGTPLATYMTLRTLRQVKAPGTEQAIRRAKEWLRQARPCRAILTGLARDSRNSPDWIRQ